MLINLLESSHGVPTIMIGKAKKEDSEAPISHQKAICQSSPGVISDLKTIIKD